MPKVLTLAIGAKVTPKPEKLDCFYTDIKLKVSGRTGVVTGHTYPNRNPIIVFPAVGRKKEYTFGGPHSLQQLEVYFDINGETVQMDIAQ